MANQLELTVLYIDGNPLKEPKTISVLTSDILVFENIDPLITDFDSYVYHYDVTMNQKGYVVYSVSENVSTLLSSANTNGTSMVSVPVSQINGNPLKSETTYLFPASLVALFEVILNPIGPVTATNLLFKDITYFTTEIISNIITDANAGGGGGGGTNPTNKFIPYNNAGTFADSYLEQDGNVLKSVYGGNDIGLNIDFVNGTYIYGDQLGISTKYMHFEIDTGFDYSQWRVNDMQFEAENVALTTAYFRTKYQSNILGLSLDFLNNQYKLGDSRGFYTDGSVTKVGDYDDASQKTKIVIDDSTMKITSYTNTDPMIWNNINNGLESQVKTGYAKSDIDLNISNYEIPLPGVYKVIDFGANEIQFPDPSLYAGQSIVVINRNGSSINVSITNQPINASNIGFSVINLNSILVAYSDGGDWIAFEVQ